MKNLFNFMLGGIKIDTIFTWVSELSFVSSVVGSAIGVILVWCVGNSITNKIKNMRKKYTSN